MTLTLHYGKRLSSGTWRHSQINTRGNDSGPESCSSQNHGEVVVIAVDTTVDPKDHIVSWATYRSYPEAVLRSLAEHTWKCSEYKEAHP